MWRKAVGLWAMLLIPGCESAQGPIPTEPPVPTAPALPSTKTTGSPEEKTQPATTSTEKVFEGITLTIPAGWAEQPPPNDIIQAEYQITAPAGAIRVTMSSAGGSPEANIQRWHGQFSKGPDDPEPQQETVSIDGQEATLVELFGTFRDGFGGRGEQRNHCMLGAVIPTGPANFFIKMTGPREAVMSHRDEFRTLVTTAKLGP